MSLSRKTYRQLFKKFDFCTCGTELLSSNEKVKDFSEKVKSRPQQLAVLENAHVECAICYELLFAPVALNCSHTFCQYCIGIWRKTRNTCPLCRISIENGNRVNCLDQIIEKVEGEMIKQDQEFKVPFKYYVITFLGFLDPLPPYVSMFLVLRISKNWHFPTPPPPLQVLM